MKLSFSINKPKPALPAPSLKRPAVFGLGEDDEPIDAAPTSSSDRGTAANKKLLAQNVEASNAMRKRMDAEKKVDATVFEYDEIWDKMQEAKQRQKEAKEVDAKERKVRHPSPQMAYLSPAAVAQVYPWATHISCHTKARSSTRGRENDAART